MTDSKAVVMCDVVPEQPAVFSYQWDWGESGVCCAEGQFLLNQKAGQLGRHIAFAPLHAPTEQPLVRSERAALKGQVYALEEEVRELQERGQKMYSELELARADARVVLSRDASQKAEIETIKAYQTQLERELSDAHAEIISLTERLDTLQRLLPRDTTQEPT